MFGWEQIIHNAAACLIPTQCPQATCTTAVLTSAVSSLCSHFVLAAHWQPLLPSSHPSPMVLSQVPSFSQLGIPADPVHPPVVHCGALPWACLTPVGPTLLLQDHPAKGILVEATKPLLQQSWARRCLVKISHQALGWGWKGKGIVGAMEGEGEVDMLVGV